MKMYNSGMLKLKHVTGNYGDLVPIEGKKEIPFEIKRVYYIYNVDQNVRRGFHSHNQLHQALICVKGSVKILLKNPNEEEVFLLNDPSEALYVGPMIWREMFDFSEDAVLLVLASEYYNEDDYIRNYDFYLEEAKKYYN